MSTYSNWFRSDNIHRVLQFFRAPGKCAVLSPQPPRALHTKLLRKENPWPLKGYKYIRGGGGLKFWSVIVFSAHFSITLKRHEIHFGGWHCWTTRILLIAHSLLFNSIITQTVNLIHVTKYETFRFFLPAGNLRDCFFKSAFALTQFYSNSDSQRDAHECMN